MTQERVGLEHIPGRIASPRRWAEPWQGGLGGLGRSPAGRRAPRGEPPRAPAPQPGELAERPGDDAAHELRARALLALGRLEEAEAARPWTPCASTPTRSATASCWPRSCRARGEHRDAAAEYRAWRAAIPAPEWLTVAEAGERLEAPRRRRRASRRPERRSGSTRGNGRAQLALAQGLVHLATRAAPTRPRRARCDLLRPTAPRAKRSRTRAGWRGTRRGVRRLPRPGPRAGGRRLHAGWSTRRAALYRPGAGWLGRLVTWLPFCFAVAFRRGWLTVARPR